MTLLTVNGFFVPDSGEKMTLRTRGQKHSPLHLSLVLQLCLDLFPQVYDGLPSEPSIWSAKDTILFSVGRSSAFKESLG
jgi:hypothetical protein